MSAGVRPERPSLEELVGERPALESLVGEGGGITPGRSKFTMAQLVARANRAVAQSEDELEAAGGHNPTTHKIMGTAASLARDVPGAEAVQAFASSRLNRIPYREALGTIRDVESDAGAAGTVARIGGGALSAAMIPGSPVIQGARYGIAHGLAQADPATVQERLHDAALQGSVGAVAPKVPGLIGKAAKGIGSNVAAVGDAALLPFSHGARVRTAGRVAGLVREATTKGGAPTAAAAVDDVAAPMVKGYQPISELVRRSPVQPRPAPAAAAAASTPKSPGIAQIEARTRLSELLQQKLDEGAAELAEARTPKTNWDLMRRIEESLLKAKAERGQ